LRAKCGQAIPGKDAETPCYGRSVFAIPGKNGNKISQVIISFSIFVMQISAIEGVRDKLELSNVFNGSETFVTYHIMQVLV